MTIDNLNKFCIFAAKLMILMKPLILISNDDGYQAKGINELIEMVRPLGNLVVCAPDGPRSGQSCAFSVTIPLTLTLRRKEPGLEVWSCNGTPVDCVKMALDNLCSRRPDLVIGGINHGDNASVNAHYSGTMGVTLEGCMKYIPSVAYSLCDQRSDADFSPLRPYVERITRQVLADGLPQGVCLNVNFPLLEARGEKPEVSDYQGIRICRMAKGTWYNETTRFHQPRGYDYWWMQGHYRNDEPEAEDTDNWALTHGYVAITPTQIDLTAYKAIDLLKSWNL